MGEYKSVADHPVSNFFLGGEGAGGERITKKIPVYAIFDCLLQKQLW